MFHAFGFLTGLNRGLAGVVRAIDQIVDVPARRATVAAGQRIFRADDFLAVVFRSGTRAAEPFAAMFHAGGVGRVVFVGLNGGLTGVVRAVDQIIDVPARRATVAAGFRVFRANDFLTVVLCAGTRFAEPFAAVFFTGGLVVFFLNGGLAGVVRAVDQIVDVPARRAAVAAFFGIFGADQFFAVVFGARTGVGKSLTAVHQTARVQILRGRNVGAGVVFQFETGFARRTGACFRIAARAIFVAGDLERVFGFSAVFVDRVFIGVDGAQMPVGID